MTHRVAASQDDRIPGGPAWWRPAMQLPGLALLLLGHLIGYLVRNPRAPSGFDLDWLIALSHNRSGLLVAMSRQIEFWDGPKATPVLVVVVGVLVFLRGNRMLGSIAVVMTGLGWLPGHVAKLFFPRDRPPAATQPVLEVLGANSFPSGHTGLVFAATITALFVLTVTGHRRLRVWIAIIGFSWAVIVGFSRMYLAVHFPTDVLGGALLDAGMTLVLWPIMAGINAWLPSRVPFLQNRRERLSA